LASIEWVRALNAGTRDDAAAMLFHLQQAEEYAGKLIPDVALLRASALRARNDFAALREAALRATAAIDRDKKMKPADKDYMKAFLWALCEPVSDSFADEERRMLTFDMARVDLSKVSRHNLMNFALLEHPEWQAQNSN
jgi:hypothetical protein